MKLGEALIRRNKGVINMSTRYLLDGSGYNMRPAHFLLIKDMRKKLTTYNFVAIQRES